MTVQKLNTPPNLPAVIGTTADLTIDTVRWHYALCDLMAAEADALLEFDVTPSVYGQAAIYAANVYLDEWRRLALLAP